jgi:hypothetical protein
MSHGQEPLVIMTLSFSSLIPTSQASVNSESRNSALKDVSETG